VEAVALRTSIAQFLAKRLVRTKRHHEFGVYVLFVSIAETVDLIGLIRILAVNVSFAV
jgi:hypothetical protein